MNEIENVINSSVNQLAETYKTVDLFDKRDGQHLPNRAKIIELLTDLRRIMFPGYFAEESIALVFTEHFIGNLLGSIFVRLSNQIQIALAFNNKDMSSDDLSAKAHNIAQAFIKELPNIQKLLVKDVEAGFNGDPAAQSREEIIFSYPGLYAIFVYRIAHILYDLKVPFIPRIMSEHAHGKTGIDINPGAIIGESFFIDHGTGVVIGETTIIGDNVKIYQGVTLGALSTRSGQQLAGKKRHPTLENNVTVYSGTTILGGNTVIGEGVVVGGNAFLTESVPAFTKVIVKGQELSFVESSKKENP